MSPWKTGPHPHHRRRIYEGTPSGGMDGEGGDGRREGGMDGRRERVTGKESRTDKLRKWRGNVTQNRDLFWNKR